MSGSSATTVGYLMAKALVDEYQGDDGLHPQTIISSAAALVGAMALHACEPHLPSYGWVTSSKVDALLIGAEANFADSLWNLVRCGAIEAGADPDALPEPAEVHGRIAAAVGSSPFPPLSVGEDHQPKEAPHEAIARLGPSIVAIGEEAGLDPMESTVACAFALATLIHENRDVVEPVQAATLALETMLGSARRVGVEQAA